MSRRKLAASAALALTASACVAPRGGSVGTGGAPPPVHPAPLPVSTTPGRSGSGGATVTTGNAVRAGVRAGPAIASLPIDSAKARGALAAFRLSCPSLVRRSDTSGLTQATDWQPACAAAPTWPDGQAASFFQRYFETALVADGRLYATGYYEPEIQASTQPGPGYAVPIYGVPDDLISVDLGQFSSDLKGKSVRGRVDGSKLVPYPDRSQIEAGAVQGHAPVIGYAADKIEFFFLQIQGSGRLRQPDGSVVRIGYAGQNGQAYTGVGKAMIAQGLITPDQGSMQGIVAWLRAHPDQADGVMRQNRSFVFFKVLTGSGPLGALGVPVTGRSTVAADPAFMPLGAPVWLSADRPEAAGLWVAQDTGGAIKGANRFDTFWGAGEDAARIAGGMSTRGTAYLLLPTGTVARLATVTQAGYGDAGSTARP
jgi:membrane-bound lytic murein transglycosylase A